MQQPKTSAACRPPYRSETQDCCRRNARFPNCDTAFNSLLNGIRRTDVKAVTNVYWNSPRLVLFNNNGTVTKGWDQMSKNRESSYRDVKDVKLDVRDVVITMLGRDGAVVSALWTQSQTYKGRAGNGNRPNDSRVSSAWGKIGKRFIYTLRRTSPIRRACCHQNKSYQSDA